MLVDRAAGRGSAITHPELERDRLGGLFTSHILRRSLALSKEEKKKKKLVKKIIKCFHDSNRCKTPTTLGENEDISAEG